MLKTLSRAGFVLLAFTTAAAAEPIKVTLLGTGVPTPRPSSFSASTLVEAGSEKLLFDLGRGSTMQLYRLKIPLGAITANFITAFRPSRRSSRYVADRLARHSLGLVKGADEALWSQGHRCHDREPDQGVR